MNTMWIDADLRVYTTDDLVDQRPLGLDEGLFGWSG
jgi:hypothetical protein